MEGKYVVTQEGFFVFVFFPPEGECYVHIFKGKTVCVVSKPGDKK